MQLIIVIIGIICIVSVWRGINGLMDMYIFPGNKLVSYLVSLFSGFIILRYLGVTRVLLSQPVQV